MLDFKELTFADKAWMQPLLDMSSYRSEEYNFSFCYLWRKVFCYSAARMNDYLLIKSSRCDRPPSYLYPPGSGDITPVIEALRKDAAAFCTPLMFHCVLADQKALLESLYPGKFEFLELPEYYDYVYDAQSLITLAGKKLHSKRNHINRFISENPGWGYEEITGENLPEVIEMSNRWLSEREDESASLMQEARSVSSAIHDFFDLRLDGGLIRAGGRVVAFSMGDRLTHDTYLVHIEKALGNVNGAYAVINREFAAHFCNDYLYINREDASGQPGLIKAKQSYRPAFLVEKYAAKFIG
ncbi:MAG: phosphatidylglycerol lysyltransferase domain-containing protein [Oscillospiraceae bacterium]|nr:phosphatidylglycerol lysyltransferase domain-containing protein [Oscillospiraceae bacterium]